MHPSRLFGKLPYEGVTTDCVGLERIGRRVRDDGRAPDGGLVRGVWWMKILVFA